jgi:hypothetical protein
MIEHAYSSRLDLYVASLVAFTVAVAGGSEKSTCSMISHLKVRLEISYCGVNVEEESHQT